MLDVEEAATSLVYRRASFKMLLLILIRCRFCQPGIWYFIKTSSTTLRLSSRARYRVAIARAVAREVLKPWEARVWRCVELGTWRPDPGQLNQFTMIGLPQLSLLIGVLCVCSIAGKSESLDYLVTSLVGYNNYSLVLWTQPGQQFNQCGVQQRCIEFNSCPEFKAYVGKPATTWPRSVQDQVRRRICNKQQKVRLVSELRLRFVIYRFIRAWFWGKTNHSK